MKVRIYAVLASLAILGLVSGLWRKQADSRDLEAQVTRLSRQNAELRFELKQAGRQAADLGRRAVELDSQLGSTKARATATETRNVRLARELSEREQREVALMAELASLRPPAAPAAPTEEPVVLNTLILTAQPTRAPADELASSRRRIAELEAQLANLLSRALAEMAVAPAPAPAGTPEPHQVVRVGPADAFVVLDYGAEHGARPAATVRLQRGTTELARVQISDVRPRFSLAQVLPNSLKGQLQTGDLVVFNP